MSYIHQIGLVALVFFATLLVFDRFIFKYTKKLPTGHPLRIAMGITCLVFVFASVPVTFKIINRTDQGVETATADLELVNRSIEMYHRDYGCYPTNSCGIAEWRCPCDLLEKLVDPNGSAYINVPIMVDRWYEFLYTSNLQRNDYQIVIRVNDWQETKLTAANC